MRLKKFKECLRHKKTIFGLWLIEDTNVSLYRVLMHDTVKCINILILGDALASKLHKKYARHHNIKKAHDFHEAYLDWASARYTKAETLDAVETARKYYPQWLAASIYFADKLKYK